MNWKNLFRFTPRAGREEFAAVGLVCNLLTFGNLLLSFLPVTNKFSSGQVLLIHLFSLPISLLAFWVGLALYSRRLHDFNLSLWWYILYVVITTGISLFSKAGALFVSALGVFSIKKRPRRRKPLWRKSRIVLSAQLWIVRVLLNGRARDFGGCRHGGVFQIRYGTLRCFPTATGRTVRAFLIFFCP